MMLVRTYAFAAGLLLAASPLLTAAAAQSTPSLSSNFPYCSWWTETTATSFNVAFPDTSAAYWTTPLQATEDLLSVTVSGQYEDARYFSLNAYTNTGASYTCGSANTSSALADYQIAPDSGSQNPFQVSAAPGGRYTVTLARSGAAPAAPNTIPLYQNPGCQPAPSQTGLPPTLMFLILRAYLPQNGFANVALPDVTLHFADGRNQVLAQCPGRSEQATLTTSVTAAINHSIAAAAPAIARDWADSLTTLLKNPVVADRILPPPCDTPGAATCPPELTFFRPTDSSGGGLFPNADNKYLSALVQPKPQTVVVIRGKAATTPPGSQAAPWNPQATELRYWSMCSNIYRAPYPVVVNDDGGQTVLGCAPDLDTVQDSSGFYTYVVSHGRDKPSDEVLAANSATWLPFSDTQRHARHLMILRNLLGIQFPQSVQNCAAGSDAMSINECKTSMADYYPTMAECRLQTFKMGGTTACFQEYQSASIDAIAAPQHAQ